MLFRSAKDPAFARAHASLAAAYATLPLMGVTLPGTARRQAAVSIERALALAPSLSAARVAQGVLQLVDFQYVEGEATLRKAIALDSADAEARFVHAFALLYLGRIDDALAEARIAVRLDPLSADGLIILSAAQLYKHQFRESIATFRTVLDIDPKSSVVYGNLAYAYALMGQPDSAVAAAEAQLKIDPNAFGVRAVIMFAFASAGRWKDVDEQRRQAIRDSGNSPNYVQAFSSVISGDLDAAMLATERGVRAREPQFVPAWLSCEPIFSPLRTHPRFVALMHELGATICPPSERWPIKPRP